MPTFWDKPESEDAKSTVTVERYDWPLKYITVEPGMDEFLRTLRKWYIKKRDEWSAIQKEVWKTDKEYARFAKEQTQYYMKLQRACTLMLPILGAPDKGQESIRSKLWPLDLRPELDEISGKVLLKFYYNEEIYELSEIKNEKQVREENRTAATEVQASV